MIIEEKKTTNYYYNFYQRTENDYSFCTQVIGKLPKIKLILPKISISENLELNFC